MKKQLQQLWDFQSIYDQTRNTTPTLIEPDDYYLRYRLGKEELLEYLDACNNDDLVEITDALADQLYILLGTMIAHGMQDIIEDVFNEVHRSNMSKLGEDAPPERIEPKYNRLVIFPAGEYPHRVTEVTRGTRSAIAINLWDRELLAVSEGKMTIK